MGHHRARGRRGRFSPAGGGAAAWWRSAPRPCGSWKRPPPDGTLKPFTGYTDLFIRPPYQFRAVDALLTNFHLPRTTLLVLVRTFGGDALIARAYEEAIRAAVPLLQLRRCDVDP